MRENIKLQSTESAYYYTIDKNKRKKPEKLKIKKYDPTLRKHVMFEEGKLK